MIKRLLCWLGFHYWLIHKVEPIVHEKYESMVFAGCCRCKNTMIQIVGWTYDRKMINEYLNKQNPAETVILEFR